MRLITRLRQPTVTLPQASAPPKQTELFDEALLTQVRRLSLTPRHIRTSGLAGEHRSLRRGSSPEFADFKSYSIGDDFRRIDWNIYSRLGSLFVRLSEVTTDISIHVLLDASESMAWNGLGARRSKFTAARQITGLLAYLALQRFDRVSIASFAQTLGPAYGPAQGRSSIQPMLGYVAGLRTGGSTNLARLMDQYLSARRRPGFLLLVSDLLSGEPEELGAALRAYRARGWEVAILHIIDPAERDPALLAAEIEERGSIDLVDVETHERLRISLTEEVIERCREAARLWREAIEQVCRDEHVLLVPIETDRPVSETLRRLTEAGVLG
jgi:uncharacterized protein (DUF58 family)